MRLARDALSIVDTNVSFAAVYTVLTHTGHGDGMRLGAKGQFIYFFNAFYRKKLWWLDSFVTVQKLL